MTFSRSIPDILEILDNQEEVRIYFAAPSQAVIVPVANDHDRYFFACVIFVIEQAVDLEVLCAICSKTVQTLRANDCLLGLAGVQIMPCVVRDSKTQRILRLGIADEDLSQAEQLTEQDLARPHLFRASTCHLYLIGLTK